AAPAFAELRRGKHGKDRQLVQTARLHFPVERNLWRIERSVGLRPARSRTQAPPEELLVAGDGSRTRRRRRSRWFDSNESRGLESERTRRHFQRSDGRLSILQGTLARRSADRQGKREAVPELRW